MALADIYQKATLVQIPSGYKAADAELYSVVPNTTAGDFTVSVDADATRVNKDGLIESVVADQARLDYDPTNPQDPTLLLEPSRTNNISKSFYQSGSPFNLGSNISFVENVDAPDGSNKGARFISNSSGNSFIQIQAVNIPSGDFTFSMYVRGVVGTFVDKPLQVFGLSDVNMNVIPVAGENWKRVHGTGNNSGSLFSTTIVLPFFDQPSGTKFDIFGFQLEQGSRLTSLIPTSGSAVTRTADTCEKSSVASGIIGQKEGVIFLDFENYGQIGTSYSGYFKIQSDGNNDRVTIQGDGSTLNRLILVVNDGSSTFFQPRTIIPSGRNKVAIRYKSGLVASFINGAKIDTNSTSFSFSNTLNTIQLQQPNKVHQAVVFNEALTDAELITLTT